MGDGNWYGNRVSHSGDSQMTCGLEMKPDTDHECLVLKEIREKREK
ncbi:MAG: hypothetical protein WC455_15385 [Dehalococcoidia bacterium]|jgi:hypothetical protein